MKEEIKDKLWSKPQIAEFLSVSYSSIRKVVENEDFPKPIKLWEGSNQRWLEREVREWARKRRL